MSDPPTARTPVAIVTGDRAGVGRAVARRFAERGYDVALLGQAICDRATEFGGSLRPGRTSIGPHR